MNAHIGIRLQRFHQAQRCLFTASITGTNRPVYPTPPTPPASTNLVVPLRSNRYRCFASIDSEETNSSFAMSNRSLRIKALRQRKANLARQGPDLPRHVPASNEASAAAKAHLQQPHSSEWVPRRYERDDCAALFDRAVPTHSLAKVDELLKRLEQAIKDKTLIITNTPTKKAKAAVVRAAKSAGGSTKTDLPLSTVLQGMFRSTNPNNSLQAQVLAFILGVDAPGTDHVAAHDDDDDHSAQTAQDASFMEQVLFTARERAILNRMCWNSVDACADSLESRRSASARLEAKLQRHRESSQHVPGAALDPSDASVLVQHLLHSLPPKNYKALCNLFETYVGNKLESDPTSNSDTVLASTSSTVRLLGDVTPVEGSEGKGDDNSIEHEIDDGSNEASTLRKAKPFAIRKLSTHVEKLAGRERYHLVSREIADFFYIGSEYVGLADDRFVSSQERWNDSKEKFIDRIMNIQQAMWDPDADAEMAMIMNEEDSDADLDLSRYKAFTNENSLTAVASPVRPVQQKAARDNRSHLSFEALPLLQDGRSSALTINGSSTLSPTLSRMVFIDNLPIDVQDEAIQQIYTRCGDLVSVSIFNRRPDLDPGPLSKAELAIRQKKNIKMVGVYGQRWRRPCTPVYGLLTFADDEGSKKAADESLRIFGTLVERHPVRSIPSSTMTRLYIEGVPDGHPCLDFEYLLGQALDPDLFVCLDAGQNNRAMVGSCEIKFPSFELAYQSFEKLQNLSILRDEESDCTLNWIRSPNNATLWWNRKLGFD